MLGIEPQILTSGASPPGRRAPRLGRSGGWCSAAAAALQGSTARVAADVDRRQGTAQPSASPNAPDQC